MRRKILFSLLVIIALFTITGCGNNEMNNNTNNQKETENKKSDKLEVKVNDLNIEFDDTGSFKGISYKYPTKAITSNVGTYSIIDYMNKDEFIFRIAFYFFENKTLDQVMSNNSIPSIGTKTINNKTWNVYEGIENDRNVTNYVYEQNDGTYTITFVYDKDIHELINLFMNNVTFDNK